MWINSLPVVLARRLGVLTLVAALPAAGLVGCNEKPAQQQPAGGKGGKGGGDCDEDDEDCDSESTANGTGTSTGGTIAGFDLCKDGLLKAAALADQQSLITALCSEGKLMQLRGADAVFTGGTVAKIFEDKVNVGDTQTGFRLMSSGQYQAKPSDYWAMTKLQFLKADVFKSNGFLYDDNTQLSEEQPGADQVTYKYYYDDGQGAAVTYRAITRFVTLKDGVSWVAATSNVAGAPTADPVQVQSMRGMIIISKKADTTTEVLTISDQSYSHTSGNGQSLKSSAVNKLKTDQTQRSLPNAAKANLAPGLLGVGG